MKRKKQVNIKYICSCKLFVNSMPGITNLSILKNYSVYLDMLSGMPKHPRFQKPQAEIFLRFIQGLNFWYRKIYLMYSILGWATF